MDTLYGYLNRRKTEATALFVLDQVAKFGQIASMIPGGGRSELPQRYYWSTLCILHR